METISSVKRLKIQRKIMLAHEAIPVQSTVGKRAKGTSYKVDCNRCGILVNKSGTPKYFRDFFAAWKYAIRHSAKAETEGQLGWII